MTRGFVVRLVLALIAAIAMAASIVAATSAPITWTMSGEEWELLAPRNLALLAVAPLLVLGGWRSLADLPRAQLVLGYVVRLAVLAMLALALARPARTTDATRVAVVFLVDVSDSVSDADLARARERIDAAWRARGEDVVRVVTFARDARVLEIDDEVPPIARHEDGAGSDLASALQLAYGLYPPGHLRRAVVLSDGAQTEGDALAEAQRAAELGVRIDHAPFTEGPPGEIAISSLSLPDALQAGQPFTVRVRVFASQPTSARLRLYQGETLNGLDGVRDVELAAGDNEIALRSVVHVPGPVTYRAELEARGEDRWSPNNRFATTVIVPGRPAVLYVEGTASAATHLARALSAGELDVDVRSPRAMPTSAAELERFDFVILSDVPADQVSASAQDALDRFVRSGGGFMMAGGEQSYGLGGWRGTRVERLLPVRMEGERRRDQPSLALALVIDRSGSMSGEKMEAAKQAAQATAELLSAQDYLEVVGFDAQAERIVRMQSAGNRIAIQRDIGRMAPRGGTAIFPGLDMAFQDLSVTRARLKHVILLTDGQTQESGLPELVSVMRAEGITVTTVGIGADVNRSLLTQLADLGGGRSYFTSDARNVPRIFMQETTTVTRNDVVEEYVRARVVAPADFLRGIDVASAPFLRGYVATRARPAPAQVILESELGEPLLARWRVGLGWSLAWTSDVKARWSTEWLRWGGFSRFWVQLVREHMRERERHELPMRAEVIGDEARVVVDAIGENDEFVNGLASTLVVEGPMGARTSERIREEHVLRQTAPGHYEARFPLSRYGSFVLRAEHRQDDRLVAESTSELVRPYPREYASLEPDLALLDRLSEVGRGRRDPSPDALFDPAGESVRRREEVWSPLLFAALALFVIDLLLRRVRLFDRAFRAAS
ncbi:VWA domain-containing protein [Sandaracinus amylolyticus]|uniref:VWA domain-containing protein n=1 Tax=Sandaracinus amylolyticus TaxID=927083 RepID=UPI001F2D16DD|nr:VWA domain-containing protein [Sandaracinus amylolyticus]UJR81079.1 von Willebrand factor type A [Sandaracinus amylolyticus]